MKLLCAAIGFASLATAASAAPSKAVIDACARAATDAPAVRYTAIAADAFEVTEDEGGMRTEIVLRHEKDVVGVWRGKNPHAFGLMINGRQIGLQQIKQIDPGQSAETFNPYEALWGAVREGKRSYLCVAFTFDGLGKSGAFQDVRGVYVIDRQARPAKAYYAVGKFSAGD